MMPISMPTDEFQLTLNRRELASVLAGLRLVQWSSGDGWRNLPISIIGMVDKISSDNGAIDPLTDGEISELFRRMA